MEHNNPAKPSLNEDPRASRERQIFLLLFFVIAFLFWGGRSLWESSEARYAEAAREMIVLGDLLVPHLAGEPHLTKPPMAYWSMAAGMFVFGFNAWGARFFASVAFLGTIFCIVDLATTFGFRRRTSYYAGLIFATMLLPFMCAHVLTTDIFLVFWETLGVLAAWRVWMRRGSINLWRWAFWIAFGFAFMTKGPPGWLPFLPLIAWYFWEGRRRETGRLLAVLPILAFLVISFWWFLAVIWQDSSRLGYFLKDEIVARVASDKFDRTEPFYYFLLVIPVGTVPWIFLWPHTLASAFSSARGHFTGHRGWPLFLALWVALPLIVFSISKSKLPLYVTPLMAPIALAFAHVFEQHWERRFFEPGGRPRTWALATGIALLLGMSAFTLWPDNAPGARTRRAFAIELREYLDNNNVNRPIYLVMGSDEFSVLFYARRIMQVRDDIAVEEFYDFAEERHLAGENPIFIARPSRIKKLKGDKERTNTLLEGEDLAAFETNYPWPSEIDTNSN